MGVPDPETKLHKLDATIRLKLIEKLLIDDNWKRLADLMRVLGHDTVERLQCFKNPAEQLIEELAARMCPVNILAFALKRQELFDALALFVEREPLIVTRQPGNGCDVVRVSYGDTLELQCNAVGFPPPKSYQWFFNNEALSFGTSNILTVENFELHHEGEYRCVIKQDETPDGSCWTDDVTVELLPDVPIIEDEPRPAVCVVGETFTLQCSVACYPLPNFQWFRGNEPLLDETSDTLVVENASLEDGGLYRCHISNIQAEVWSKEVKVTVYPEPNAEYEIGRQLLPRIREPVPAKVALLIGNNSYERVNASLPTATENSRLTDLIMPCNDVETLSSILSKMGFRVLAFHNLTKTEMRNAVKLFCNMLQEGSYGIFYFAGHGFELDDKFMLPVNAPESGEYLRCDCMSERELLSHALERKPKLLFEILDMCLIVPERDQNPALFWEKYDFPEYKQDRNIIRAYATSSNLKSFERKHETNGLYVKYLKKFLGNDLSVLTIVNKVSEEFENNEPSDAADRMMPSVYYNTSKPYFLTDPVIEHEDTTALYDKITSLPTAELKFESAPMSVPVAVEFKPHRNCFLNSIDIIISSPRNWIPQFTTMDLFEGVQRFVKEENGSYVLTIAGLQKVKVHYCLQVHRHLYTKVLMSIFSLSLFLLQGPISFGITFYDRTTRKLLNSAVLDLGTPLIVPAGLWYDPHEAELEQLYRL
ncbi:mucosa-associated lymphoid tissue lymphoma translocation protein 1 homolog isoform X1 [Schistocerca serialis cubense]|uniref:mucosa-associated lymphoid tissue lymphoma translocation protein 1 homolog isoform X1 n=1 Tax=Schistocerca serialis cubense TaxID=2023355 RepID=UPI00214EA5B2|nr:mucosa-associated lymphoid tissue lymphoma translocation protein 1 homolog isoform X1 [Schistocerca serialis cubense]